MSNASIKTILHEGQPCIEIKGQWSPNILDSLIKAFQKAVPKSDTTLFLKLTELDYLDSAALGVIMFHMNELARKSAKIVLLEPSPEMRQILHTISLDKILEIR